MNEGCKNATRRALALLNHDGWLGIYLLKRWCKKWYTNLNIIQWKALLSQADSWWTLQLALAHSSPTWLLGNLATPCFLKYHLDKCYNNCYGTSTCRLVTNVGCQINATTMSLVTKHHPLVLGHNNQSHTHNCVVWIQSSWAFSWRSVT